MTKNNFLLSITLESNITTQKEQPRQLATDLRNELRGLDGIIAKLHQEELPEGVSSRVDAATIGTIIVSLGSAGAFTALIQLIQAWMNRKREVKPKVQIKIQIGDKLAEFAYSPDGVKEKDLLKFVQSIVDEMERVNIKPLENKETRILQNGKSRVGKKHKG